MAALTSAGPAIAKLEGSGYGRADGELPIDINYQKLTEWLVSRKKMPADWHKRVQAIQAKITEAAKALPPGLLAGLPGGADAPIDYFRAVAIRDALAQDGERTLFGGLAGAAGVWDAIVKAYEKQNVFMGEAASTLVANVDYELPYIRKQATRYAQLMADGERKAAEYTKGAATAAANYKQECERLGIAGADVRRELTRLGARLPTAYQELLPDLRGAALGEAADYYAAFVKAAHLHGSEQQSGEVGGGAAAAGVLPILAEVREGRTAAAAEPSACSAACRDSTSAAAAAPVEIDWDAALSGGELGDSSALAADSGAAAAASGGGGGIDWDLDLSDLVVAAGDETGDAGDAAAGTSAGPAIAWDIELTAADVAAAAEGPAAAVTAAGGAAAGVGAAEEEVQVEAAAARLAADPSYRTALADDLAELRAFLSQRCSELGAPGSGAELLSALLPPPVAAVDAAGATQLLAAVDTAASALAAPKLRQLALIAGSARYADRLARELGRRAGQEAKLLTAAQETEARRHESRAALAGLAPRSAVLAERTRAAQRAVEAALSIQLGRRVLVLGEINNALAAAEAAAKGQA